MRVLLICGDYYHPVQVFKDGIAPLEQMGFQFDILEKYIPRSYTEVGGVTRSEEKREDFSVNLLREYPVAILSKPNEVSEDDRQPWKTEAVQRAFVDYVEGGGGLLALHSGVVGGENTETLDKLIGCRFVGHPNACPVTFQPVKPHPVTDGVGMFCETDEHYRIEIIAPDANIIAASYSPPQGQESKYQEDSYFNTPAAVCTAAYLRQQGKGRVCVLTPGHFLQVWLNPQFQKLFINALRWTAGE